MVNGEGEGCREVLTAKHRGCLPTLCKECRKRDNAIRQAQWRKKNPERAREIQKKFNEQRKPERWRNRMLRDYGLSVDDYERLLEYQGGGCAICGGEYVGHGNRFHIDHDHACCPRVGSCGKCIRGLLCSNCNTAVGLMNDDPKRLRLAADYLDLG